MTTTERIEAAAGQAARAKQIAGNGRDDEAMALLWDALPVLERELGVYHPEVNDAVLDLAAIHMRRGEEDQAAMLLARVQSF